MLVNSVFTQEIFADEPYVFSGEGTIESPYLITDGERETA